MQEDQRRKLYGRILPSVFIRAVQQREYVTALVLAKALLNAYLECDLIAEELKHYIKAPKGEDQKNLARNTANAMKRFNETGDGEDDYRIIPNQLFQCLTTYPMLAESLNRVGDFIRAVLIEESEVFGISKDDIDEYLDEVTKDNPLKGTILYFRKQYQTDEAERKAERANAKMRKREQRRRQNLSAANRKPDSTPAHSPSALPQPDLKPEVEAEEADRVLNALAERHPKKGGNPVAIRRAIISALRQISGEELIAKHDRWCSMKTNENTEVRYYPTIVSWLNQCLWKQAPDKTPLPVSNMCSRFEIC